MSEYKLEIKQLVDFPRCRIYRQFIRMLHRKRDIRMGSHAGLFHYALLGSYATATEKNLPNQFQVFLDYIKLLKHRPG